MPAGIAAAVGVASSVGNAVLGSNAANSAAKAQQNASNQNVQFENQVYNTASGNLQPFVNQGQNAGSALGGLLGLNGNTAAQGAFQNYLNSTNYQFLLNQGLQGQAYANAPNLFSGATGKALNNYAQGMAGNALQGYEGLLQNQQGLGIQSGLGLGNIGTNIAGQEAQARNLAAGAQGTADLYGANAWGNALNSAGNLFGQSSFQNALGGLFGGGNGFNPSNGNLSAFQSNPGLDTAFNAGITQVG